MLSINETGKINKMFQGRLTEEINFTDVTEKEILLVIAARLYSIRGMMKFFTALAILGLLGFLISILSMASK